MIEFLHFSQVKSLSNNHSDIQRKEGVTIQLTQEFRYENQ